MHALIVGPDSRDGTLEELSSPHGPPTGACIGPVGKWGTEKLAALVDADCFALPSLTETSGAAAEAAAMGFPVVVSDACGVAEVLDRTVHRVVSPSNVGELTQAITELVIPDARSKAVEVAEEVRSRLDWVAPSGRTARDVPGRPGR